MKAKKNTRENKIAMSFGDEVVGYSRQPTVRDSAKFAYAAAGRCTSRVGS
jgi:hypothetical protein